VTVAQNISFGFEPETPPARRRSRASTNRSWTRPTEQVGKAW